MRAVHILCFALLAFAIGCGSKSPSVVAEQDELQKWVSANPEPANQDPTLLDGAIR